MNLENFISEALCNPCDHIAYFVSRKLAEVYPDKFVIEGALNPFDLEEYARAGRCDIISERAIHNQIVNRWRGEGREMRSATANGCFDVLWQGNLLDVVKLTWSNGRGGNSYHWIVADREEIAREFVRAVCDWCAAPHDEILEFDDGVWNKSRELFESIEAATFDNLILRDELKEEIRGDFRQFFAARDVYARYRIPWRRGVLLAGSPGNGKTHTVKALINDARQACIYVRSFGYDAEINMRAVFERARRMSPCVVVLEDLDSLVTRKTRSFFLNELDGFAHNAGLMVLATTNYPERLDDAIIKRPSRFDRVYHFALPDEAERARYIARWNAELTDDMRLAAPDVKRFAASADGFSFAYLKELFVSALLVWSRTMKQGGLSNIIEEQIVHLREQMNRAAEAAKNAKRDDKKDEDNEDEDDEADDE